MKLKAFKILVLILISYTVTAQEKITGFVEDENQQKLANINIYNKTNNQSAISDESGNYTIEIITLNLIKQNFCL